MPFFVGMLLLKGTMMLRFYNGFMHIVTFKKGIEIFFFLDYDAKKNTKNS